MKLSYFSVSYYRSITDAYKINLENMTVLIGKNNEGKTNLIKSLTLAIDILNMLSENHLIGARRRFIPKSMYDWYKDFPISLQNSIRLKNKLTKLRLDFSMTDKETRELSEIIGSSINHAISIYIEISNNNTYSITVPKKGKNAKAITNRIIPICCFICDKIGYQYIPAIRSQDEALSIIYRLVSEEIDGIDDPKYLEALQYIDRKQQEQLERLSQRIKPPLQMFLPAIKDIHIYNKKNTRRGSAINSKRNLCIDLDDGVETSLTDKGDGVKSLATIALLSEITTNQSRLIIVEEPENHLHPEAIRYISTVLQKLAETNQILVSTHNPIYINRNKISSNIIIENGHAIKAERLEMIRKCLGVICSDNLMYSDYVIVVEGPSDKAVLTSCFNKDSTLKNYLANKRITIHSIGGTDNLSSEIYSLQRYCCAFLVILDYDSAGKEAANSIKTKHAVSPEQIRFFMRNTHDAELEDMYKDDVYRNYLFNKGIDINDSSFKNRSKKWSTRIQLLCTQNGIDFTKDMENDFKKDISNIAIKADDFLNENGKNIIKSITEKIKQDVKIIQA